MKVSQGEIVAAARELFRAQGYAGASMQDLADRVGLKKASLYSRFSDKEALVVAVLQLTLEETLAAVDTAAGWRAEYEAILRSMADALMGGGRCVAFHLAYGVSAATPRASEAVRSFFTTCRRRLAETLSAVVAIEEADRMAADALAGIEGATLWLAIDGDRATMRRTLARLLAEADSLRGRQSIAAAVVAPSRMPRRSPSRTG